MQEHTMEQERPVTLREQELLRLGDSLAMKFAQRDRMVTDKAEENKRRQGDIDKLTAEMSKIAELIREKRENRAQGDLFVDQMVEGERCRSSPRRPRRDASPTRPNENQGIADRDPNAPHAVELGEQPEGEPKACLFCSRLADDPLHAVAQLATEIAQAHPCSRCGKTPTNIEPIVFDRDVKPVCPTCVRAAIEAATWPHVFEAKDGIVPSKSTRCRHCKKRMGDEVHVEPPPPVEASLSSTTSEAEKGETPRDPAYDFTGGEEPDPAIRSARAIADAPPAAEDPQDAADDGNLGVEAGA